MKYFELIKTFFAAQEGGGFFYLKKIWPQMMGILCNIVCSSEQISPFLYPWMGEFGVYFGWCIMLLSIKVVLIINFVVSV